MSKKMKEHIAQTAIAEDDELLEKEFDFSKAVRNPYAKALKKQISIKVDPMVLDYFKEQAMDTGIPYQTLINLYLRDCVKANRKLDLTWRAS